MCIACSAGKYLTNAAGGTEAGSCTSVSRHVCMMLRFVCVPMSKVVPPGAVTVIEGPVFGTDTSACCITRAVCKWALLSSWSVCLHSLQRWQVPDERSWRHGCRFVHKREWACVYVYLDLCLYFATLPRWSKQQLMYLTA